MNRETREKHENILYREECYVIQGAIFEVYKEMGCGFLEAVYQECLELELRNRNVPFEQQMVLPLSYKENHLKQVYVPDLICYGKIIVELKAVKEIAPEHKAQLLNYLKATDLDLGLLVNFGAYPKAQIIHFVNQFSRLSRFSRLKNESEEKTAAEGRIGGN
jgi:GxxExxY protein